MPFSRFSAELTDVETAAATSSVDCSGRAHSRGGSGGGLRSRGGSCLIEIPKIKKSVSRRILLCVLHQVRRVLVEFEP